MRHPMAGALCTEMKRGQVRTWAVIKSRSAGEAQSWCGAQAPRCSAPRPGLRLCSTSSGALGREAKVLGARRCPGLGARPTELSALPAVPVQTAGADKHLLGAEPLMAVPCRAVPSCALAVLAAGHWGTAQGGQAAAPAVGWGPGACHVSLTPSCR